MKTLSIIGILTAFLILSTLNSCKDEESINPIVGTWEYSETLEGLKITLTITFNTDLTGLMKIVMEFEGQSESETVNFTYSTNSNKLTLIMDGESQVFDYSISGNKLTLTDEGEDIVFTKK